VSTSQTYTKTIIRLRLSKYWRIFTEPSLNIFSRLNATRVNYDFIFARSQCNWIWTRIPTETSFVDYTEGCFRWFFDKPKALVPVKSSFALWFVATMAIEGNYWLFDANLWSSLIDRFSHFYLWIDWLLVCFFVRLFVVYCVYSETRHRNFNSNYALKSARNPHTLMKQVLPGKRCNEFKVKREIQNKPFKKILDSLKY